MNHRTQDGHEANPEALNDPVKPKTETTRGIITRQHQQEQREPQNEAKWSFENHQNITNEPQVLPDLKTG